MGGGSGAAVAVGGVGAEFAHASEDGDAAAFGFEPAEGFEGGDHGVRVGVVGVVEEREACDGAELDASGGEGDVGETVGDGVGGEPVGPSGGGGEGGVSCHVAAGEGEGGVGVLTVREVEVEA